ncbi:MAG: alpha-amylase, partial [Cytophagaceae bacterium]
MKKTLLPTLLATALLTQACEPATTSKTPAATTPKAALPAHPAWILQGNIYEVNVRQYTPEGTL